MYWDNKIKKTRATGRLTSRLWRGALLSTSAFLAVTSSAQAFDAVFELSSLDGSNGFVLNGIDQGDASGSAVSDAGDVNGDGIDDLLIGVSSSNANGIAGAGESYVFFGGDGVGGTGSVDLASLNGNNGFVLNGINQSDLAGRAVSSAGDVNGDGVGDILIGARAADPNGNARSGQSYIVFGGVGVGNTGSLNLSGLDGTNGFSINGVDANDSSGGSLSNVGDFNSDGFDDFVIGAHNAAVDGRLLLGEAYIVFGGNNVGNNGSLNLNTLDGINGFTVNGIDVQDQIGTSLSGGGDLNGDGISDLVIGANFPNDNGGESYVIFGGAGVGANGRFDLSNLDGSNGFLVKGIDAVDHSGRSVSITGDVNGDGLDDLLIGAPRGDPNGTRDAGEVYVIFGGANVGNVGEIDLTNLDGSNGFVLNGVDGGDITGYSVSGAGDINGDGLEDIVIGANSQSGQGNDSSLDDYVVFGGVGLGASGIFNLFDLDGLNGFVVRSQDSFDSVGRFVSGAGDINNDGLDDLLLGAPGGDVGTEQSAGQAYVIFGQQETVQTPLPASLLLLVSGGLLLRRKCAAQG